MIELILVSVMALAWVPAVVLGAPSRDAPCRIADAAKLCATNGVC